MIFVVEFLEDAGVLPREPARIALEAADESEVVAWLTRRGRSAYVRRLFDPYGFLWLVPPAETPGVSPARPNPTDRGMRWLRRSGLDG